MGVCIALAACAREAAPPARVDPIATVDAGIADATASDAANDVIDAAPAPRVEITPDELRGDFYVSFADEADAAHIHVTTLGLNGTSKVRRLTNGARVQDDPVVITQDGLVFLRTPPDGSGMPSILGIVSLDGTNERELARCVHICDDVSLGADGRVHFIDRNVPKLATIKSVSTKRGKPDVRVWSANIRALGACYVGLGTTPDRSKLFLWANNDLGWPECKGSAQGIYFASFDARTLGKPVHPKHALFEEDELHSPVRRAWMRAGSDRIFFEGITKTTRDWPRASANFSCRADGSDVRLDEDVRSEWRIETTDTGVVAKKPGASDLVLLAGLKGVRAVVFSREFTPPRE